MLSCMLLTYFLNDFLIIIIIIIIILFITFRQGIYNSIPETNHVSGVYSVAAFLYLQFVHVMLYRPWNVLHLYICISRSKCAVPSVAVFVVPLPLAFPVCCSGHVWVTFKWFQSPLLLPLSLLLSNSTCTEFQSWVLYILKSSRFLSWSHFCRQKLQHLLTCYIPCLFPRIILSGLLLGIVLSVRTCWFRNMVALMAVSTDVGTWSYQCL